ncbi:biopolymer transporter Tol [Frondihabitans sp. PAMC 28766]|nr:biopolymer transporter Tol [Frondihabitans sp. PAMC 28766]
MKREDDHWLVISGRRWRKTDPSLPPDVVAKLQRSLGRARSEVGRAKRQGDTDAEGAARQRVDLAKHGLGERGAYWWDEPIEARIARAREKLNRLRELE